MAANVHQSCPDETPKESDTKKTPPLTISNAEQQQQPTTYSKILERPIPRFPTLEPVSFSLDTSIHDSTGAHDLEALQKLEAETESITENLSHLLKYLQEQTFEVTETSSKCLDVLKSSVDETCDVVDDSIKMMYKLIAKCDEIAKSLSIVDTYCEEARSLKKALDLFENTLKLRSSQYVHLKFNIQ